MNMSFSTIVIRFVMAMAFGAALGFERTRKLRGAGLRTYTLVCVGAAAAIMSGLYIFETYQVSDPTRMASQVISGIGFIGAGTIMVTGFHSIKGLTTAAGLWTAACMGIVIGEGFYEAAVVMLLVILFSMLIGAKIQTKYLSSSKRLRLYVLFDNDDGFYKFVQFLQEQAIVITEFEIMGTVGKYTSIAFVLKFPNKEKHSDMLELIKASNFVAYVDEM